MKEIQRYFRKYGVHESEKRALSPSFITLDNKFNNLVTFFNEVLAHQVGKSRFTVVRIENNAVAK